MREPTAVTAENQDPKDALRLSLIAAIQELTKIVSLSTEMKQKLQEQLIKHMESK